MSGKHRKDRGDLNLELLRDTEQQLGMTSDELHSFNSIMLGALANNVKCADWSRAVKIANDQTLRWRAKK